MSNYLNQAGKENLNNPVFIAEGIPKSYHNPKNTISDLTKQGLATAQPLAAAHIGSGMPEPYMSAGGYYANGTGFAMSFPNFSQPAQWSTGTNNPQAPHQNYEHTTMQYSTLGAAPSAPTNADVSQNHQYMTADHLFNQNSSAYQNAFSAPPYMNGNWSYFNNPNSFFFPTGTGDLNLSWGTAATDNPNANALFQDLYKPTPPQSEQDKSKIDVNVSELSNGFENGEAKSVDVVEQSFSTMSVSNMEKQIDPNIDNSISSSVNTSNSVAPVQHTKAPSSVSVGQSNAPAKPVSWAAVASQPAKSKPPPKKQPVKVVQTAQSNKPNYSSQNGATGASNRGKAQQSGGRWNRQNQMNSNSNNNTNDIIPVINDSHVDINRLKDASTLLKKLMTKYNFNPREFSMDLKNARFFIIKSYSEDDIFRSIKYSSWTSTEHGNRRLNDAYKEQQKTGMKTPLYLLFSVNSSGHFCGVAEMKSEVDLNVETGIWVQDKWKGRFDVRWIYVKDVPNNTLRHIRLENNENKPVTNSRDTQEVHPDKGKQVLKIIHNYKAQTSIFDDFSHYEKRQEEDAKMRSKKMPEPCV